MASSPSETLRDSQATASGSLDGSTWDREWKGVFVGVPGRKPRQPPSVLFAWGDISWHGTGQDSNPDPPPLPAKEPSRSDEQPDPPVSSRRIPLPRARKVDAKSKATRAGAVATAVTSMRETQAKKWEEVEACSGGWRSVLLTPKRFGAGCRAQPHQLTAAMESADVDEWGFCFILRYGRYAPGGSMSLCEIIQRIHTSMRQPMREILLWNNRYLEEKRHDLFGGLP